MRVGSRVSGFRLIREAEVSQGWQETGRENWGALSSKELNHLKWCLRPSGNYLHIYTRILSEAASWCFISESPFVPSLSWH